MADDPKRDVAPRERPTTQRPRDGARGDTSPAVEAVKEEARQLVDNLEQRRDRQRRGEAPDIDLGGPGNFGGGDLDDDVKH